ncbi:hypothetical protein KCV87_30395 [Actinosynnema pretiosum subsp. pretiosum]|uniref:Uncharacterized protein n=2 Tax=Actinosynnema TaxID=40566 RepID=C6WS14_ACTMD|nr:hypothetical protein [Actinosynnema mirum]ACU38834.1 hypothetical protein Amir_5011 [Actinosynnema mirum DSM 43827]AXX32426.1 hypothetical protein APASM_5061 [Actinosynnema pretiosum subsp. pretiosum]QUF03646.1 hypothetical protein KCV87_30395 [Actinosynnema pretiosum subsp. pretiosum]
MTHPQTTALTAFVDRAQRPLWLGLAALFALVGAVNVAVALNESAWWQAAVAVLLLGASFACARSGLRTRA